MTEGQLRVWLRQYCLDLAARTRDEIEEACGRYRRDRLNKFMATSGDLLDLSRRERDRKPIQARFIDGEVQPWGGACRCRTCARKIPREGFYRAAPSFCAEDARTQKEIDAFMGYELERLPPVRPGERMGDYLARTRPARAE